MIRTLRLIATAALLVQASYEVLVQLPISHIEYRYFFLPNPWNVFGAIAVYLGSIVTGTVALVVIAQQREWSWFVPLLLLLIFTAFSPPLLYPLALAIFATTRLPVAEGTVFLMLLPCVFAPVPLIALLYLVRLHVPIGIGRLHRA